MHHTSFHYYRSALVLLLLGACVQVSHAGDDWKLGTDKDGIKVYTRKSEQGKIRTSRAEMFLPVTVDKIITVLNDFDSYGGWFPSCKEAKILKRVSDTEFLAILTYKTPWPLPNLDCVERMFIERRAGNDTSFIRVKAEPDASPATDATRVKQMQASWKLIPMKGGTYLINEYYTDMGGIIPAWLANTQAVDIPFNIFTGVRLRIMSIYGKK